MDEERSCDICGEIPIKYNLADNYIRNSLVKMGIRKWLFCDECIVIVDSFVNNLQALRPSKIVDFWPIPEDIADAADVTAQERRARIEKNDKKISKDNLHDRLIALKNMVDIQDRQIVNVVNQLPDLKQEIEKSKKLMHDQYYDLVQEIGDLTRMVNDRK